MRDNRVGGMLHIIDPLDQHHPYQHYFALFHLDMEFTSCSFLLMDNYCQIEILHGFLS